MKTFEIENSDKMSILIEAIIHSEKCSKKGKLCNTKKNWDLVNNKSSPNKIIISGKIMKPLSEYVKIQKLDYHKALRLTICLAEQVGALNDLGFSISHFDTKDVLVLSEDWYLITNTDNILPLEKDKITIMKPFTKSLFLPPEIKNIDKLPAIIDHRSSYFSIALVVIFSLGLENSKDHLEKIYPSPLYFLLERCLDSTPNERKILLL